MKKAMIAVAVAIMMMFGVANVGADCGEGMVGLEITGGATVGIMSHWNGNSVTVANAYNCSGGETGTTTRLYNIRGNSVMTSASGTGCAINYDSCEVNGGVVGDGNFMAKADGNLGTNINFKTKSVVTIGAGVNCCPY